MDSLRYVKSFESNVTLLAGYRRLDSAGDDLDSMTICSSSEDDFSDSDSDCDSDSDSDSSELDAASDQSPVPRAPPSMTDSLDLYPLLGSPGRRGSTGAAVSRHVPSWVMRARQDDSNANALPAGMLSAMSSLSPPLNGVSPMSPAIEKAEIERSEKLKEINGNVVLYKDGARPKDVVERVKTSRHAATVMNKSPKHHRRSATADETERRDLHVHFSNDAGAPRKREKMLMNTSLKMGLESPRRPRPNTLPVASRQAGPRAPPPEALPDFRAVAPEDSRPVAPIDNRSVAPADVRPVAAVEGRPVAPPDVASGAGAAVRRREKSGNREEKKQHRKSCPVGPVKEERPSSPDGYNGFDVYNLETSLPKIDWEAIENHLKSVREEERKRRNDRDAIRRKLAMGHDPDDSTTTTLSPGAGGRPGRKPSLQSRLQGGMNLQICFMNETASDEEEEEEEEEGGLLARRISGAVQQPETAVYQSLPVDLNDWPKFSQPPPVARQSGEPARTADFVRHQAQLQSEARLALAQAKQMARWQMEVERQNRKSPISDVVRVAFQKIGVPFPDGRRRVSRQLLTEMNIAQLQVIVNDFHTRIEALNEALVRYLMERDEQHMEQDSKLVHIEDLTSYFGQKHQEAPAAPPPPPPPAAAGGEAKRRPLRIGLGKAK